MSVFMLPGDAGMQGGWMCVDRVAWNGEEKNWRLLSSLRLGGEC